MESEKSLKVTNSIVPHQFTINDQVYEWMDDKYFLKVNEIPEGQSFGADALNYDEKEEEPKTRNATIKAMDETAHFAVLSREDYLLSIKKNLQMKLQHKIDFLKKIPCFSSQTRRAIQQFSLNFKPKKFRRGQTVYQEGQPAKCIYIVHKGEFELS